MVRESVDMMYFNIYYDVYNKEYISAGRKINESNVY